MIYISLPNIPLAIHMLIHNTVIHNTVTSIIFQFRLRFGTGIDWKACFQL